ncbi:MAG: hypothetical protein WBO24_07245 [Nitrospirales bacterium]
MISTGRLRAVMPPMRYSKRTLACLAEVGTMLGERGDHQAGVPLAPGGTH